MSKTAPTETNGYTLMRNWFEFAFNNSTKINPNHGSLYFFCIEHYNRMGWKSEFGLPASLAMEAMGMKSHKTYIKTLLDLIDFGFIKMIKKSTNQYSANVVAMVNFTQPTTTALTEASHKQLPKQVISTYVTKDSIDKHINNKTIKPLNKETNNGDFQSPEILKVEKEYSKCMDVYNDFIKNITGGAGAKIDGQQGKAMKSIIAYVKSQQYDKDADVSDTLKFIFDNWNKVDPFLQKQTTLSAINSRLQDILIQIKNGKQKHATITDSELREIAERNIAKYGS